MSQERRPAPQSHRRKEKRPPLTHFLCLPLVNPASLPQLESSIAAFKSGIPPSLSSDASRLQQPQPLIPDGAIRPVGTLHLTLGVMSLPTKERFNDAVRFFQQLDLVSLMSEAEIRAKNRRAETKDRSPGRGLPHDDAAATSAYKPFTISLESLHALPRARAATVLHAAPVDPTFRLYPFCELLRDKFLEAGFLQGETQKENPPPQQGDPPSVSVNDKPSKAKVRPLLLHATVVNTIYIKGRKPRNGPGNGKGRKNDRYAFDAGDILAHYRDYYVDSERTTPRSACAKVTPQAKEGASGDGGSDAKGSPSEAHRGPRHPFVWARDFRLESLCICEMGAKKLDANGDPHGMGARLGEKYAVVAERRLSFEPCGGDA